MKLILTAAAFLSVAILARYADAADKPSKPVVCLDYEVVRPDLAVCSDSKKPFVLRSFAKVQSTRPDGSAVSFLVGWR